MSGKQYLKNQLPVILINLLGMLVLALFLIASDRTISVWSKLYFWYHTSFTGRINKPHYEIRTDYFFGRNSFLPYLSPLLFLIYRTEKDKRWIKIRKG